MSPANIGMLSVIVALFVAGLTNFGNNWFHNDHVTLAQLEKAIEDAPYPWKEDKKAIESRLENVEDTVGEIDSRTRNIERNQEGIKTRLDILLERQEQK